MTRHDKAVDVLRKAGFTAPEIRDMLRERKELRSRFAARAMQGLLAAAQREVDSVYIARASVACADSLLRELAK